MSVAFCFQSLKYFGVDARSKDKPPRCLPERSAMSKTYVTSWLCQWGAIPIVSSILVAVSKEQKEE